MRVISGIRKGHRLKSPSGMETRPTEDKVKESLFNILGPISNEAKILDLFAGSGSIGIEFLSRGAKECYFIDKSINSIKTIKLNLDHTKLQDRSQVFKLDSLRFLSRASREGLKFDYIYVDPPFKEIGLFVTVLENIYKKDILSEDGLVLVEHTEELNIDKDQLYLVDKRKYGSKYISFYKMI